MSYWYKYYRTMLPTHYSLLEHAHLPLPEHQNYKFDNRFRVLHSALSTHVGMQWLLNKVSSRNATSMSSIGRKIVVKGEGGAISSTPNTRPL